MQSTYEFLKAAEVYYIATVNGDLPRVRPFSTVNIYNGKLYIQTGKNKDVTNQILANPKVELCALKGNEWIRVACTLVLDEDTAAQEAMLDAYPSLRGRYTTGPDGNTAVFYIKDATASIISLAHEPEVHRF